MRPTSFEFAGGEAAFLALARAHHARCLADAGLNHPFSHPGQHPQHVERLAASWGEVLGGPPAYSRSCGDLGAYMRWAVGDVLADSTLDGVQPGAAMPRWSRDRLRAG